MILSRDHILTTHVGSLPRNETLSGLLVRREEGEAVDRHELAREMDGAIGQLHAHFLHTPASVARYAALLRDLPWTASAHAKDIWTTPDWEKREKLASCRWLVTCTATGQAHLAALAPPGCVTLAYHGIDLARFPADIVIDVVRTHPMVIIGGILQQNPFFVHPDEFLQELHERRATRAGSLRSAV